MISFIFFSVGILAIVYFIKDRNKKLRDNILNNWFTATATVVGFEQRIEKDSDGDKTTVYIVHGEYDVNNVTYHFEENIAKHDMYNISYINIFYNPVEPNEYITEKSFNSAFVQPRRSANNRLYQDKVYISQDKPLNKDNVYNGFLSVFLIPFIVVPIIVIQFFAGGIIRGNVEYEYVSKNWTLTSANITNIQEYTYYDDEGSTTTYTAQGEYIVDSVTYTCSKEVSSDNQTSFSLYYNPNDASQYSVRTEKNTSYLYMVMIFCIFWTLVTTCVICKLKNPIRIIYLLIMYGGSILSIIYNIQYTFIS